ncbi:thioredoxin domain-containing protein 6 [Coelomomyces lativittatus]|nr:thioredoxin domain-containing protein 6 [Coelomomyces lativittatus]
MYLEMETKKAIPDIDIPQIIRPGTVFTPGVTQINYTLQNSNDNLKEDNDFTVTLVKPDGMLPSVLQSLKEILQLNRMEIVKEKRIWLTPDVVKNLYPKQIQMDFFNEMIQFLTSAPCMAYLLSKENAVNAFREMMGPYDPNKAKSEAPRSIRALHASDPIRNVVHGSSDSEQAQRDVELLFSPYLKALPPIEVNTDMTMSVVVLGPELSSQQVDAIVASILTRFQISQREQRSLEREKLMEWLQETPTSIFEAKVGHWGSGPLVALVVKGEDVLNLMNELIGPEDPEVARQMYPFCLRALYGTDIIKCGLMASSTQEKCHREHNLFFPRPSSSGLKLSQRTLALIKPDVAMDEVKVNEIKDKIHTLGFICIQSKQFQLSIEQAREFYREHLEKPFFDDLTTWMSSSPIWAFELEKENAITLWRETLGPTNSETARTTAPQSLRALYGTDEIKNGLHGSDSVQSAEREVQLIFGSPNMEKETVWTEKPSDSETLAPSNGEKENTDHVSETAPTETTNMENEKENTKVPDPSTLLDASVENAPHLAPISEGTTQEKVVKKETSHSSSRPTSTANLSMSSSGSRHRPTSAVQSIASRSVSKQKLGSVDKLSSSTRLNASSTKLGSVNKLASKTVSKSKLASTKSLNKKDSSAV